MPLQPLEATARRYAAVERRLFEVVGSWVPATPDAETKLVLRKASFRHGWHSGLWEGLLPVGSPAAPEGSDALALPAGATTTERLEALYGVVLPALVADYERLLIEAERDVAAGGPLRRVLRLALADDRAELAVGKALLGRMGPREPSMGDDIH